MDISAARSLFARTFSAPKPTANIERITPTSPVKKQEEQAYTYERSTQQEPLVYSLKSLRTASLAINTTEKIAAEKSSTQTQPLTINQNPNKVSQKYLNSSVTPASSQIDLFV